MIRAMVAEDIDLLRESLCELISSQEDMTVVGQAASGREIVKKAQETPCDVILMDIEMETINAGILAAETLREACPKTQIIFLTAHETDQMIITALGTGSVDYIVKGCPDEDLLLHIRSAHEGKPMMDARIQRVMLGEYSRLRCSERSLLFFINNVSQLTSAERELTKLLLEDKKVKEIAQLRCVEVVTVKTQIKGLLRKFGCSRTKEIVEMIRSLQITHLF